MARCGYGKYVCFIFNLPCIKRIKYISNSPADAAIYYKKKKERDRIAQKEYRQAKGENISADELFIVDIIREGMKQNDERLR